MQKVRRDPTRDWLESKILLGTVTILAYIAGVGGSISMIVAILMGKFD